MMTLWRQRLAPSRGQRRWGRALLSVVALAIPGAGCRDQPLKRLQVRLPDVTVIGPALREADGRPPNRAQRRKRKRYRDAPVYLDGTFVGMLKFSELPPSLPTIVRTLEDGRKVLRFGWSDYLESIGAPLEKVRAVHMYGGRDIVCVVSGDELRRVKNTFRFSFTRGNAGLPRLELPPGGVAYNTYVDKVRALAVYVDKVPPSYENNALHMPDGQTLPPNTYPYADGERHGGTRVYLDGAYRVAFKRRQLKSPWQLDPSDRGSPYRMGAALRGLGVAIDHLARVQLYDRRDRLLRDWQGEDTKRLAKLQFTLPKHNRGRILVVPETAAGEALAVESIQLFWHNKAADRGLPDDPTGSE